MIKESKTQVDSKARNFIKMIENWQQEQCARFDMIQQHVLKMPNHELENTSPEKVLAETLVGPVASVLLEDSNVKLPVGSIVSAAGANIIADAADSVVKPNTVKHALSAKKSTSNGTVKSTKESTSPQPKTTNTTPFVSLPSMPGN